MARGAHGPAPAPHHRVEAERAAAHREEVLEAGLPVPRDQQRPRVKAVVAERKRTSRDLKSPRPGSSPLPGWYSASVRNAEAAGMGAGACEPNSASGCRKAKGPAG